MDRILPKSLKDHWENNHNLIQVITGPRQVGKTTAITTIAGHSNSIYASADLPTPPTTDFIISHWHEVRKMSNKNNRKLILDEIQKIPRWSETVKALSCN